MDERQHTPKTRADLIRIKCCAFCGLTQRQVALLIQGPAIGFESIIHICGDCAKDCAAMAERHEQESATADLVPPAAKVQK